jgi:ubiquinone/menaquinone biosynthesis C-methylase UbiE
MYICGTQREEAELSSKPYFDEVAPRWDTMRRSFFSDGLRDKALAVAALEPGQIAADLGAGTGFLTEALVGRGLRVIAVDQSETMLATLASHLAGRGEIEGRLGDAERLPIADGEVDHAFANMYLHHVERPEIAVREMARIVRPGGTVVITDMDEHDFAFLRTEQHDRWLGFARQSVRVWLEAAGLIDIQVECAEENCSASSEHGADPATVSLFLAWGRR